MLVKITKATRPYYWYKDLIGECVEVRPRVGYKMTDGGYPGSYGDQFYVLIEKNETKMERYIAFNDCVECSRYMKLKKIKDKIDT